MGAQHLKRIATLQGHMVPLDPLDTIAEAGRKVLLVDFIKMLSHETGSRIGEDIEHVHDMRVATRRMRSALRLFKDYFMPEIADPFARRLRKLARALGAVRDLDVQIDDLNKFQPTLDEARQATLQTMIDALDEQRFDNRGQFITLVDSTAYDKFIKGFSSFLTTPGQGAKSVREKGVIPLQVRHVLPVMIYQHLAAVRAYDAVLENADPVMFHALRIEFKRLRYTVSFFEAVLGSSIKGFIGELKIIQDHLGRMNDFRVARETLESLLNRHLDSAQAEVMGDYFAALESDQGRLQSEFADIWARFNSRAVQRKLSDALLVLR